MHKHIFHTIPLVLVVNESSCSKKLTTNYLFLDCNDILLTRLFILSTLNLNVNIKTGLFYIQNLSPVTFSIQSGTLLSFSLSFVTTPLRLQINFDQTKFHLVIKYNTCKLFLYLIPVDIKKLKFFSILPNYSFLYFPSLYFKYSKRIQLQVLNLTLSTKPVELSRNVFPAILSLMFPNQNILYNKVLRTLLFNKYGRFNILFPDLLIFAKRNLEINSSILSSSWNLDISKNLISTCQLQTFFFQIHLGFTKLLTLNPLCFRLSFDCKLYQKLILGYLSQSISSFITLFKNFLIILEKNSFILDGVVDFIKNSEIYLNPCNLGLAGSSSLYQQNKLISNSLVLVLNYFLSLVKENIFLINKYELRLYGFLNYLKTFIFNILPTNIVLNTASINLIVGKGILLDKLATSITFYSKLTRTTNYQINNLIINLLGQIRFLRTHIFNILPTNTTLNVISINLTAGKGILLEKLSASITFYSKLIRTTNYQINNLIINLLGQIGFLRTYIFQTQTNHLFTDNIPIQLIINKAPTFTKLVLNSHFSVLLTKTTKFEIYSLKLNITTISYFIRTIISKLIPYQSQISLNATELTKSRSLEVRSLHCHLNYFCNFITDRSLIIQYHTLHLKLVKPIYLTLPPELKCWFNTQNRFISIYEYYGIFVALLRHYFSNTHTRIPNSVEQLIWPQNIRIEIWPGKIELVSGNLPAIFVSRSSIKQQKLGLGHRTISENEFGEPKHAFSFAGEIVIHVISTEYNQTLILGSEIHNFLQYYRRILTKYLGGFIILSSPDIKGIKNLQQINPNAFHLQIAIKFLSIFSFTTKAN